MRTIISRDCSSPFLVGIAHHKVIWDQCGISASATDNLQQQYTKAVDIGLFGQLPSDGILWCKISSERRIHVNSVFLII